MATKSLTVFYSWQSWTKPDKGPKNNRNFIQDALERAAKQVVRDDEAPIIIDRDTKDVPGTPPIIETILEKIDSCDMYVADVSYVMHDENRYTPNPNVMIELGYALKRLTGRRLILVMNTAYGSPENHALPFDFQHRRYPITYHLEADADESTRRTERDQLVGTLKYAIELVVKAGLIEPDEKLVNTVERCIGEEDQISLDKIFHRESKRVFEIIHEENSRKIQSELATLTEDGNHKKIVAFYHEMCGELLEAFACVARYGEDKHSEYLRETISLWFQENSNKSHVRYFPIVLLIYTVGIAAILHGKWVFLKKAVLSDKGKHPLTPIATFDYITNIVVELILMHFTSGSAQQYVIAKDIYPVVKELLANHYSTEQKFERAFVTFDFLLSFQFMHTRLQARNGLIAAPPPRISNTIICEILNEWGRQLDTGIGLSFLSAGLFDGKVERFREILLTYREWQQKKLGFWGRATDYLNCLEGGTGNPE